MRPRKTLSTRRKASHRRKNAKTTKTGFTRVCWITKSLTTKSTFSTRTRNCAFCWASRCADQNAFEDSTSKFFENIRNLVDSLKMKLKSTLEKKRETESKYRAAFDSMMRQTEQQSQVTLNRYFYAKKLRKRQREPLFASNSGRVTRRQPREPPGKAGKVPGASVD